MRLLGALLLCGLAACSRPPLTAESLRMPVERAPGYVGVETRFVIGDDPAHRAAAGEKALEQMRRAKIASTAEYLYQAGAPSSGRIKVRVELFVDEPAAQANWKTRHRPEALAMTQPFNAGDEGWIYSDQMAGVRVGRSIFEFRVKGKVPGLAAFARSYAEHARATLKS